MTGAGEGHHGPVRRLAATTVMDLIDREIAAHPGAPAVFASGRTLSYAELDRQAETVAVRLQREFGVRRGETVLIAGEAGIDFTATVVGVLRAGAAYLPVDMSYPADRIAQICRASSPRLVVVTGDRPVAASGFPVATSEQLRQPAAGPGPGARPPVGPADAAYVIFTSGSTGVPKGIVQTHRCLLNFVAWQVDASGLGRGRKVLQAAPLTFDVSVQEIFYTLASGGCLCVPGKAVKQDPRDLVRFLIDHDIEIVDFPQSLIDVIMTLPRTFAHAPALRHLISAGETVRVTPALEELLTRRPDITLHNHYGPAENHMLASHSMSSVLGNIEPRPPVGSLVWNTYVYLLDERGEPVPDGEPGEIYIGGAGLARGYTDPALSRTVFVDDPYLPGARVYRTRDRGRWRADGTLELLGRLDDLIKVRGNAVEPQEVEQHLVRVPGVDGAAVFGVSREGGATELHAALTGDPPPGGELRRGLLRALPDYMVPTRWWVVDSLPRSAHGKLDRSALPGLPGRRPLPVIAHQENTSR